MRHEELAAKTHRTKTGARFYKAFYWRGEWCRLTGLFGKVNGLTVAQAMGKEQGFTWTDENGDMLREGTPIRNLWQEIVPGVTTVPWG
ncbi:hypothetical protein PHIM7_341 [Sinorhizobium phage phiM7]|uniref:Uncharacterized protein n=3 Tax=Emdodecavirus TaxID=1980937 RepID=S5M7L0_9CAUD|nr:hypothetical protein AB690_gp174 [Sinorhizobium phage phiM12]YP_009212586.1 hypothetical protein AVT40_gp187 [Sinorhizobium phage phiN3]YP_009601466.1 hypothetical protein FDH46_gp137 [Sinorhizobium phage phiM7]AKF13246.1 hypothetical protein PHIM19_341 [Sinorhizobium phage phiM19]AGR48071.1 hypothetical protein SmphiM12_439 [Sinorhizobium phage phiM12]AKF12886.1 hypothetical protein PHIM7_341 [Sinorhizobium phage phiM7]AKF13609.1 hypothetical protein PHIN3_346 [Sinorhizobium phage phiN3]